ncbi:putative RNA-directed DNA polymerase, eukaryota, reverse transcriptase zinc-binding domain protein [Tanacetum coccineum]
MCLMKKSRRLFGTVVVIEPRDRMASLLNSSKLFGMLFKMMWCGSLENFFQSACFPKGCNSSFIALIPKIGDAKFVSDFRPISLIGCQYKIIGKLLANRLSTVIGSCVSFEQSAFIKGRNILDGPLVLNECMAWYRKRSKALMVFKVDFEKAFDSLRWDYLDVIMEKLGFGFKWRMWISGCLKNSRASILINGSPTPELDMFNGLRQGDPMSPFLFILAMEGLHALVSKAVATGLFKGASIGRGNINVSHLLYADDAIFVGEWSHSNAYNLLCLLRCFYTVSGLKINVHKSKILGVNVLDEEVSSMALVLGCGVAKLPMMYLGVPIGCNMGRCDNWKRVVQKFESKMNRWKAKLLSVRGRLSLIKASVVLDGGIGSGRVGKFPHSPWNTYKSSKNTSRHLQAKGIDLIALYAVVLFELRNACIFSSSKPKKANVWDSIVHYSFLWISSRNPKSRFRWIDWLGNPIDTLTSM